MPEGSKLHDILIRCGEGILVDWFSAQMGNPYFRRDLIRENELRVQCKEFLTLMTQATAGGELRDLQGPAWKDVRDMLGGLSRSRSEKGFSPSETAIFLLSLKSPLFKRFRQEVGREADLLFEEVETTTELIDNLALYTTEVYQKSREQVIGRQKEEMLELSTPVVKLWKGVLALPMIGTLDSNRTQVVMETLLQKILEEGAEVAIIDITGVPTVDTVVAQHLMKTVNAARLMGAECIISGIRPQIAQTIVHLAIDLGNIVTKSTLADAFQVALQRLGLKVAGAAQKG